MSTENDKKSYIKYDELKPAIDEISRKLKPGRYMNYEAIGKSIEGRDIHFVVLAKDEDAVDQYLYDTMPKMMSNPSRLQYYTYIQGAQNIKVPIFFNNIHPDEPPTIDAILALLKIFATEEKIVYRPSDNEDEITINIDEVLNHIILLFNFTANPDGLYHDTRTNANGFDLNRDNAYQTQPESKALISQIVKWNPITLLDFHGYIKDFLIEPSTAPHDPNYEYDLLLRGMVPQAITMGNSVTANTKYKSYIIPFFDRKDGWDDSSPRDLSSCVLLHGILGHTIEIPNSSEESLNALIYAALAAVNYVMDNKYGLFMNLLECFRRSINEIDSRRVDRYLTNGSGEIIGRPRGNNESLFPEYYVIPVDKKLQRNPLEAYNIVEYLLRNGVRVYITTEAAQLKDFIYPKGTYIVPMYQVKRGFVNSIFYSGIDFSDFNKMHALMMMNFPALRGFDVYEVRTPDVFDDSMVRIRSIKLPSTTITGDSKEIVIRNSNNDAVKAVNRLLNDNKTVRLLLESKNGYNAGDYLVYRTDLNLIKDLYLLDVLSYNGGSETIILIQPKVANVGKPQTAFILKELGFNLVDDVEMCNVIVDDYGEAKREDIENGKHYIGIGGYSLSFIEKAKLLPGFDYSKKSFAHEGLIHANMSQDSLITAGYREDEMLYFSNGSWIEKAPAESKIFARASNREDYFVCGWWPGHEAVKGKILGITHKINNSNIILFASDLTTNGHPQDSFRFLANAIFTSLLF